MTKTTIFAALLTLFVTATANAGLILSGGNVDYTTPPSGPYTVEFFVEADGNDYVIEGFNAPVQLAPGVSFAGNFGTSLSLDYVPTPFSNPPFNADYGFGGDNTGGGSIVVNDGQSELFFLVRRAFG